MSRHERGRFECYSRFSEAACHRSFLAMCLGYVDSIAGLNSWPSNHEGTHLTAVRARRVAGRLQYTATRDIEAAKLFVDYSDGYLKHTPAFVRAGVRYGCGVPEP